MLLQPTEAPLPTSDGEAPRDDARAPNETSAGRVASMWPAASTVAGTTWQSPHVIGARHVEEARCAACAPTPGAVVAVLPSVSRGGAGLPLPPWHASHGSDVFVSTTPSTCSAGAKNVALSALTTL